MNDWIKIAANALIVLGIIMLAGGVFSALIDVIIAMFKGEEYGKALLTISMSCILVGAVLKFFYRDKK